MDKSTPLWGIALLIALTSAIMGCGEKPVTVNGNQTPKTVMDTSRKAHEDPATPPVSEGGMDSDPIAVSARGYIQNLNRWDEILKHVSQEDAQYLRGKNASYFGSISFNSLEERNYLSSAGFPLPEEWLAAKAMSDHQLKALSDGGNVKAKLFYLDRLIERAETYLPLREGNDAEYRKSPGGGYSLQAYELATQMQMSNKSPFMGYLLGSTYSKLNYPPSPEAGAAGIFVAYDRGDKRALALLNQYEKQHPDMKLGNILTAHNALK